LENAFEEMRKNKFKVLSLLTSNTTTTTEPIIEAAIKPEKKEFNKTIERPNTKLADASSQARKENNFVHFNQQPLLPSPSFVPFTPINHQQYPVYMFNHQFYAQPYLQPLNRNFEMNQIIGRPLVKRDTTKY
jgi:hypothetical protein